MIHRQPKLLNAGDAADHEAQCRRIADNLHPIQNKSPGADKESIWLPAPDGSIYMVMRLYWPREEQPSILPLGKGAWKPPAIRKAP